MPCFACVTILDFFRTFFHHTIRRRQKTGFNSSNPVKKPVSYTHLAGSWHEPRIATRCTASFPRCFRRSQKTVSYTHLDVYKRQDFTRLFSAVQNRVDASINGDFLGTDVSGSKVHRRLDVYKRQAIILHSAPLFNKKRVRFLFSNERRLIF